MRFERNTAKLSSMVSCFIFYKNKVNEGYQLKKGLSTRAEGDRFVVLLARIQVSNKLVIFRAHFKFSS